MKKQIMIGITIILVVFTSLQVRAAVIMNEYIPFNTTVFVPCALDGVGEDFEFNGEVFLLVTETVSKSGMRHTKTQYQPIGLSGIGLTSGEKYQLNGGSRETIRVDTNDDSPQQFSWVYTFNVIGQGSGNNYTLQDTIVFIIDANGNVTVSFENFKVDCK